MATRDSYVEFRGIDSAQLEIRCKSWQEMELNQYLYMNGEVGKLFRHPRGPDSGFLFYSVAGQRRTYFEHRARRTRWKTRSISSSQSHLERAWFPMGFDLQGDLHQRRCE